MSGPLEMASMTQQTARIGFGNKKLIDERFFAAKRRFDPHGLLNPGKLVGAETTRKTGAVVA